MKITLVIPSKTMAKGLESVLTDAGQFTVEGVFSDLSRQSELLIRNFNPDAIVVDPVIFAHSSRSSVKQYFSRFTDAAIVAFPVHPLDDESIEQFDAVLNLYDAPTLIIKKLRDCAKAVSVTEQDSQHDAKDLTVREKEILVCVAQGMLNKEIADKFNISIHTVITHRKNITGKTGIKSIAGLTVYALLNNLLDPSTVE